MFFLLVFGLFTLATVVLLALIFSANASVFFGIHNWWLAVALALFVWVVLMASNFIPSPRLGATAHFLIGFLQFYLPLWLLVVLPLMWWGNHHWQLGAYVACFVLAVLLSGWASYNFHKPITVSRIDITSPKVDRLYRFLHVTDTQFGSLEFKDLVRINETVTSLLQADSFDAILFTGDMVDTNFYDLAMLSPLSFDTDIPKYFSYGNHEFYHDSERQQTIIDQLGYTTLRNTKIAFSETIDLIGIDDAQVGTHLATALPEQALDSAKFNILLYHRPTGVDDAKEAGTNLMLVGHTHGGQVWPYTWFTNRFWGDRPVGLTQEDDFTLYHSSGVGLWGAKMRLGSENEVTVIEIRPR